MAQGDATYERKIQADAVTVPERHAAQRCCVIAGNGMVLGYHQVGRDGTIGLDLDAPDGREVTVVIPGDASMESHDE